MKTRGHTDTRRGGSAARVDAPPRIKVLEGAQALREVNFPLKLSMHSKCILLS